MTRLKTIPASLLNAMLVAVTLAPSTARADAGRLRSELSAYPHQIVFETYRNNNWDLYRMNADGSGVVNLTNTDDIHELYPQVSPDASRICFISDEPIDGQVVCSVYVMNSDGSGRKRIGTNLRQPCWGPDGKFIAYAKAKYDKFTVTDYAAERSVRRCQPSS